MDNILKEYFWNTFPPVFLTAPPYLATITYLNMYNSGLIDTKVFVCRDHDGCVSSTRARVYDARFTDGHYGSHVVVVQQWVLYAGAAVSVGSDGGVGVGGDQDGAGGRVVTNTG